MAVDEGAVVDVVADALGEGDALALAAEAGEIGRGVEMGDALDLLLDDRAGVEIRGDVVAGGADEFHAALVRLFVRVRADEGGEEGVMDVDDFSGELAAEGIRQDLHEAGEDDELHVLLQEEIADFQETVFPALAIHFHVMERDTGTFGERAADFAVADDRGDLDGEFVEFGAPDDLVEAVVGFGDEDGRAHFVGQGTEVPFSLERATERTKAVGEILGIHIEIAGVDLKPCKKLFPELVGELAELDQVPAVGGDVGSNFRHDAGLVGRGELKNQTGTHGNYCFVNLNFYSSERRLTRIRSAVMMDLKRA